MKWPQRVNNAISDFASLFVIKEARDTVQETEQRSIGISDTSGILKLFGLSESGVNVTEETALGIAALWAGVDIYCSLSATLPRCLYKREQGKLQKDLQHPASILINHMPEDEYVPFDFRYSMRYNALMRGGAGAEIIRDRNGNPVRLRLMRYGCTPYKPFKNSDLIYYDNEDGTTYQPEDVYFIPGIMVRDGNKGMSLLDVFREKFGVDLSHRQMISKFLKQGPLIGGVYTTNRKLDKGMKISIKESFSEHFGGSQNAGSIYPIGNAENFKQFQPVNFAQGQMVEMANFSIEEVARILRMPVSLLQSLTKPSYNSLEQMFTQWKVTTLDPMFTREDQECNKKLLRRSELGVKYFETQIDGLMWSTAKERAEYWWKLWQMGMYLTNDGRKYLNFNPVEGGDEPMVQVNMTTLKNAQLTEPKQTNARSKGNPKQTVLFEEKITTGKNGKHSHAAEN